MKLHNYWYYHIIQPKLSLNVGLISEVSLASLPHTKAGDRDWRLTSSMYITVILNLNSANIGLISDVSLTTLPHTKAGGGDWSWRLTSSM